jgi:hypothetical protein
MPDQYGVVTRLLGAMGLAHVVEPVPAIYLTEYGYKTPPKNWMGTFGSHLLHRTIFRTMK